jgi:peptidoglycan/xylan/chitin deacetylase (PgdA/CDA1 family)
MHRPFTVTTTAIITTLLGACNSESQFDTPENQVASAAMLSSNGVTSTFSVNAWNTGYCVSVTLNNSNSTAVTSFTHVVHLNQSTVVSSWSANFKVSGSTLTITPLANTSIPAKGTLTYGFCGLATGTNFAAAEGTFTVTGGGSGNIGGSSSTGGTTSKGSSTAVGGSSSTGGTTTIGGSTSFACGLPVAGTTGVAKPSGTPGNLKVLNWAGLKGAVSYTFDDGNSSQTNNYSTLKSLGIPLTFYLVTGWANASNAIWAQAVADGHELGNHTQTHPSTGTASDVDAATTFLQQKFGVKAWTMAAPNGSTTYIPIAQTRFLLNRGVGAGYIAPNGSSDPFNLPTYIPPAGASTSALNSQVVTAQAASAWQVFVVHGFTGGSDGAYQPIALSNFVSHVNYTKNLGNLWIDTMTKIGAYWRGQKALSSVTPTTSGTTKTYSWSLPANFPPGKCLRVTVDGGTLKQGGKTLLWNNRGYYEIALDAGSVTVSP